MNVSTEKTVRDLALENPAAPRVFEKLGIDYCCGGKRPLAEACRAVNLNVDEVLELLAQACAGTATTERDWQSEPIAALITHIRDTHHKYTREEIGRLTALLAKVCSVHGNNHPELLQIRDLFQALSGELTAHMMKEEMVLFPYMVRLEAAVTENAPVARPPFGSVQNPIAMMEHEHDSAGSALHAMREASSGYTPPSDACISYQTLYKALAAFEADLHQHIHLENNVLFPRAVAMERARSAKQTA